MKVLNFGSCNIDYVYSLEHIVESGETENAYSLELFAGGKGLNQSVALAKAGAEVFHAGVVGNDGELLIDTLKENGIDVAYIKRTDKPSGHAIIQVDKQGRNSIIVLSGANGMITEEYTDSVLEHFDGNDILLLQNEINGIDRIIDKAYEKKMRIVLNPSPVNSSLDGVDFGKLTYIILNETEIKAISGETDTETALKTLKQRYPRLKIMLTLGCDGCIYSDSEQEVFQPVFAVNAVDTTAAGDTFTGYFISEIINSTDYALALRNSSAASAIAVSRKGASASIPKREEVMSFLKSKQ